MEIIWHGKKLIENNSNSGNIDSRDPTKYAMDLLLAKYHRDYARRNRRSNYNNAKNEYENILQWIESDMAQPLSNEQKRQYLMISMEALYNIISIQRREYHLNDAINSCRTFILDCTRKIELLTESEINGLSNINKSALETINEYVKKVNNVCLNELDLAQVDKADKAAFGIFVEMNIIDFVTSQQGIYDVIRYFLLVTLDFSRILRDMHKPAYCKKAIKLADYANQISKKMDLLLSVEPGENNENNIDALMIESGALRKYIKYAINEELNDLKQEKTGNYTFREGDCSIDVVNALGNMKMLADSNHFSSKIEITRWYCLGLKHKALREVSNFPTKAEIFQYFDENDTNIEVSIRKGKVLLDLQQFEDAIQLFQQMLEDYKDETFYIRLGSRGLKIRYMLANAYISAGNISKAKTILQDLYDKIKEVNESKKELPEGREGDVDFRVIMDLIYCNMRQGNYDDAYKLYELHEKDFYGNKKLGDAQELPGNGFIIGENYLENEAKTTKLKMINNLIGCCILSIDNSVFKEDNKSNEEIMTVARKKTEYTQKLCVALRAFVHLRLKFHRIPDNDYENDPETNLYKGFFTLLTEPLLSEQLSTEAYLLDDFIEEVAQLTDSEREKRIHERAERIVQRISSNKKTGNKGEEKTEQKQENGSKSHLLFAMLHAQKYFKIACNYSGGFSFRYKKEATYREDINGLWVDRAKIHHQISYFSAYLINLVRIYQEAGKLKNEIIEKNAEDELKRMLAGFPKNYMISLKAAIALAEWILDEENKKTKPLENELKALDDKAKKEKLLVINTKMDKYYRPFGFVTIYEEEGAAPFNQLRDNHSFRLLESTERARVMVRLLTMYNPIKAIIAPPIKT